jgi:hypothetical protein
LTDGLVGANVGGISLSQSRDVVAPGWWPRQFVRPIGGEKDVIEDRRCPWSHAVEDLYRRARCKPEEVEGVGWLALRLLGESGLDYAPEEQIEAVRLVESPWRILLSPDLSDQETTMAIARALSLWWLAIAATHAPRPSDVAELARAIAIPIDKLDREIAMYGYDADELAEVFVVSAETVAERFRVVGPKQRSGLRQRLTEAS